MLNQCTLTTATLTSNRSAQPARWQHHAPFQLQTWRRMQPQSSFSSSSSNSSSPPTISLPSSTSSTSSVPLHTRLGLSATPDQQRSIEAIEDAFNHLNIPIGRDGHLELPKYEYIEPNELKNKPPITPLARELHAQIKIKGPLPVSDYMFQCLQNNQFGYYMTKDNVIGPDGDFITSPELTQMFGEIMAVWLVQNYRLLNNATKVNLVELGPGKGTLMWIVLRTIKQIDEKMYNNITVHFVETSPVMRKQQMARVGVKHLTVNPTIKINNNAADEQRATVTAVKNSATAKKHSNSSKTSLHKSGVDNASGSNVSVSSSSSISNTSTGNSPAEPSSSSSSSSAIGRKSSELTNNVGLVDQYGQSLPSNISQQQQQQSTLNLKPIDAAASESNWVKEHGNFNFARTGSNAVADAYAAAGLTPPADSIAAGKQQLYHAENRLHRAPGSNLPPETNWEALRVMDAAARKRFEAIQREIPGLMNMLSTLR